MNIDEYQHPSTITSTNSPAEDFQHSIENYESDLSEYLPQDKNTSILDVGCGWGQFLWWLKEKGYTNIQGIDIGKEQELYVNSIGLKIMRVEDSTEFLESRNSEYGLIVMNHIIEHMPAEEGIKMLKAAYNALRPGGQIIVQTPNMSSIGANCGRYIEISHITGYTEKSLAQMLGIAGFAEVKLFGNKSAFRLKPRRLVWMSLQYVSRLIWRMMLLSELGTDSPKIIEKNLYAVGLKP